MRHAEKDRSPEKARKRAVNDARCALRKLEAWARELRSADLTARLQDLAAELESVREGLESLQAERG